MRKVITEKSLLRYLYDEASVYESIEIEEAMDSDPWLERHYTELSNAQKGLPKGMLAPPVFSVRAILAYSKSARLEEEVFGN